MLGSESLLALDYLASSPSWIFYPCLASTIQLDVDTSLFSYSSFISSRHTTSFSTDQLRASPPKASFQHDSLSPELLCLAPWTLFSSWSHPLSLCSPGCLSHWAGSSVRVESLSDLYLPGKVCSQWPMIHLNSNWRWVDGFCCCCYCCWETSYPSPRTSVVLQIDGSS